MEFLSKKICDEISKYISSSNLKNGDHQFSMTISIRDKNTPLEKIAYLDQSLETMEPGTNNLEAKKDAELRIENKGKK